MTAQKGVIGRTVAESVPYWADGPTPATGAPNILFIVLDDLGYAQLGCYGASIRTPSIDALAARGLRYTNFHVTPLCSPTRACFLTGRNHHSVGMAHLAQFDTGYSNCRGAISPAAATLGEMLSSAGYATLALGKWHLTPSIQLSPAGPFDQWPTQRGFDRFYGFVGGEDDQWNPELWEDQHYVDRPRREGSHLSENLVDKAQAYLSDHFSCTPQRPYFLYLAFGACHAPHQAPRAFIDRYKGVFDDGWDVERDHVLERQISMGVVPSGTTLAPPNPGVKPWASLTPDEKRLAARMQEVFAGFTEHTDTQIGRLIAFLEARSSLDDTIVIVVSDNGASGEGGAHGSVNEYRSFLRLPESFEDNLEAIDALGGPFTHNHYPAGWAQAGNTPLKFYKRFTYAGGVRAPFVISYPNLIKGGGGVRMQFHHAIDIVPTILEAAAVSAPTVYRGVEQIPVHGTSVGYTFADANAAGRVETQYFEMGGQRGIWHRGWKALTHHSSGESYDDDVWQLYHLECDFSETDDLAEREPKRLREMIDLWWREADAYGVFPLDDRSEERANARDPRTISRNHFVLFPGARLLTPVVGPNYAYRPFRITAYAERRDGKENGVLLAHGRRPAGFALFVHEGRLFFDFNLAGRHTVFSSPDPLPLGPQVLGFSLDVGEGGPFGRLLVDNVEVARHPLPALFPAGFGLLGTHCGFNAPSPVSALYEAPFAFQGRLDRVIVDLGQRISSDAAAAWTATLKSD